MPEPILARRRILEEYSPAPFLDRESYPMRLPLCGRDSLHVCGWVKAEVFQTCSEYLVIHKSVGTINEGFWSVTHSLTKYAFFDQLPDERCARYLAGAISYILPLSLNWRTPMIRALEALDPRTRNWIKRWSSL